MTRIGASPGTQKGVAAGAPNVCDAARSESRARPAGSFESVLRRRGRGAKGPGTETTIADEPADRAMAALFMAGWSRREGPVGPSTKQSTSAPVAAGGASPAPPVDRLLLGSGPAGAEARLTISHGALAGAQIHLRGGALKIEAVVLTQTDSSRHTLGLVMQEVARRLHSRGYVFRASSPASDEPAGRWGQPRDADGPERERRR